MEPFKINKLNVNELVNDKNYKSKHIYYDLDGQNIFKRVDRYRHRIFLIIVFTFLILVNLHEILFNIIHLFKKINPDYPYRGNNDNQLFFRWNIYSQYIFNLYIIVIHLLSIYTFCKLRIDTKIYY